MFDNLDQMYPDVTFWILSSKVTDHEIVTTLPNLTEMFGEERLARIQNGFDKYWVAWQR